MSCWEPAPNVQCVPVFRYLAEKYLQQLNCEEEEEPATFHQIGSSKALMGSRIKLVHMSNLGALGPSKG